MSKYDEMRKELKYSIIDLDADHYNLSKFMQVIDEIFIKYRVDIERPKIGGWIPCSERLPEERQDVLVFDDYNNMYIAHRILSTFFDNEMNDINVIAWQPLPEAYHG